MKILSNPEQVCFEHALEFWAGLLGYGTTCSDRGATHDRSCTCQACEESSPSHLRAVAIAIAGPSPRDHEHFAIRLAS
jgi:hypothetical protein